MKFKLIDPAKLGNHLLASAKTPSKVIEFVPMVKENVGIGWITLEEADASDFKKHPVVNRPWLNPEKFNA